MASSYAIRSPRLPKPTRPIGRMFLGSPIDRNVRRKQPVGHALLMVVRPAGPETTGPPETSPCICRSVAGRDPTPRSPSGPRPTHRQPRGDPVLVIVSCSWERLRWTASLQETSILSALSLQEPSQRRSAHRQDRPFAIATQRTASNAQAATRRPCSPTRDQSLHLALCRWS
jgi:hypothetical protein